MRTKACQFMMVLSFLACYDCARSESALPGRNIKILDYPRQVTGSIAFLDHAEPDWNLIYKYDLSNKRFTLIDRFNYKFQFLKDMMMIDSSLSIGVFYTERRYFVSPTGNCIFVRNIKDNTLKTYDLPGEVNSGIAFSKGQIFVVLRKYKYLYEMVRHGDKIEPTTTTVTEPLPILMQIDAATGKQKQIVVPGMQNKYPEYSFPCIYEGDPDCVYFEYSDLKKRYCMYKYNFMTGACSKSPFPEPFFGPDGRIIHVHHLVSPPRILAISRDDKKNAFFVPYGIDSYAGAQEVLYTFSETKGHLATGDLSPDRNYYSFLEYTENNLTIDAFDIKQRKLIRLFTEEGNSDRHIYYIGWIGKN